MRSAKLTIQVPLPTLIIYRLRGQIWQRKLMIGPLLTFAASSSTIQPSTLSYCYLQPGLQKLTSYSD